MKHLKFVTLATALFAVMTLSSCFRTDDPINHPSVTVKAEKYAVVASSNAEVTFSIDVPATEKVSTEKKVSFTNIDTNDQIVKVTATLKNPEGYARASQTATIKFSKENSSVNISFVFTKKSSDTASQDDVKNSTTDVTLASNFSDIDTKMIIPGGTTVISGSSDAFCITTYQPTPSLLEVYSLKVGQTVKVEGSYGAFKMSGTPANSTFNNEITLKIFVGKELAGESFTMTDGNGNSKTSTVDADGYVEFKVSDITTWTGVFETTVTKIEKGSVTLLEKNSVSLAAGDNTYNYTKKVGIETDLKGFMLSYFQSIFGNTLTTLDTEGTIYSAHAQSRATIKVIQNYVDVTLSYGGASFTVRVWTSAYTTVTVDGHSGGNGF